VEPSGRPYHALRHPDFRRFAGGMFVSLVGSHMQNAAIDWHVWTLTKSPLLLGMVGLSRLIPIVVFSLVGGVVADRYDRRRVLVTTQVVMMTAASLLSFLTATGRVSVFLIYVLTGVSAGALAFDSPARHSFVPRLVPARDLPGALAVMLTGFHFAAIGGPAVAGLLLSRGGGRSGAPPSAGLSWVYALNALSFLGVIAALLSMRKGVGAPAAGSAPVSPFASLKEGIRFVFTSPLIVWTMVLDFFATFFSGSMSLLPIFADRVLGVGAAGYGWLRAAPGLGAAAASAGLALRNVPRQQGRVFLGAVAAYGAATVCFGLSRGFALTLFALTLVGLTDTVSTVIRQTVRALATPDALRGRMTSVNMIFFQGGPQLGELEAGVVASLFASAALGATVAVVSGGLATIGVVAFVAWRAPFLRSYDLEEALRGEPTDAAAP
jgi:MFS family permease